MFSFATVATQKRSAGEYSFARWRWAVRESSPTVPVYLPSPALTATSTRKLPASRRTLPSPVSRRNTDAGVGYVRVKGKRGKQGGGGGSVK